MKGSGHQAFCRAQAQKGEGQRPRLVPRTSLSWAVSGNETRVLFPVCGCKVATLSYYSPRLRGLRDLDFCPNPNEVSDRMCYGNKSLKDVEDKKRLRQEKDISVC